MLLKCSFWIEVILVILNYLRVVNMVCIEISGSSIVSIVCIKLRDSNKHYFVKFSESSKHGLC